MEAVEVKPDNVPEVRDKNAVPAELSQHEFLLRTNSEYRDRVVVETILKMAQLIDALAAKNGLTFENGKIVGLDDDEQEKILLKSLGAESSGVREWSPRHEVIEASAEDNFDGYMTQPDPEGNPTSETTEQALADAEPSAETDGEESDDETSEDDGLTPKQRLKNEAEALGLDSSGTKDEIWARIEEFKKSQG